MNSRLPQLLKTVLISSLIMEEENVLIKERLQKLAEIKEAGINPFPYKYDQKNHAVELHKKHEKLTAEEKTKDNVSVAGRIVGLRRIGKATFMHLLDQSGKIQLYFREEDIGTEKYSFLKKLDMGDLLGCEGLIFKTKTGEVTVNVTSFVLLGKSLRPLPEKFHGLKDQEIRYRQRYVDLIVNPEVREVFILRAKIIKTIRQFLDDKGFMEVQTPIIQTQYGGANARPFVSKINAWNMPVYLRIAYELHLKRLIVGGFEKIYDLSSCFRNEGIDHTHNPEFSMIEIQWAYADYNDVMKLMEELFECVALKVLGTTKIKHGEHTIDVKAPWKRMTMKDALKTLAEIDIDKYSDKELFDLRIIYNIEYHGDLNRGTMTQLLFEELCESKIIQPTHIIDHPKETCPLAKPHRKNPELIERVEPFIVGWEFGNGYSELTDPQLQKKLLQEQAEKGRGGDEEAHPMDEDYVHALEFGLPPNAGLGIGIDRMIMLFTGKDSIRDVILFPTMKPLESSDKK